MKKRMPTQISAKHEDDHEKKQTEPVIMQTSSSRLYMRTYPATGDDDTVVGTDEPLEQEVQLQQ